MMGRVIMDRRSYDPSVVTPTCWIGRCASRPTYRALARRRRGRLRYAVTPRFAVSCSAAMLRESAALARPTGTYWQTHLSEDPLEIAEVARPSPTRSTISMSTTAPAAWSSGPSSPTPSICPTASSAGWSRPGTGRPLPGVEPVPRRGMMPLRATSTLGFGRAGFGCCRRAGRFVFRSMRVGAYAQSAPVDRDEGGASSTRSTGCGLGTLEGARALGLDADRIARGRQGSRPIAVDPGSSRPSPRATRPTSPPSS